MVIYIISDKILVIPSVLPAGNLFGFEPRTHFWKSRHFESPASACVISDISLRSLYGFGVILVGLESVLYLLFLKLIGYDFIT
jgi:hypothetical protein